MGSSLIGVAAETMEIVAKGRYTAPSGASVSVAREVAAALAGSRVFLPADLAAIEEGLSARTAPAGPGPAIEVTDELTGAAARRLVEVEGLAGVAALNFANGTDAGGGFVLGARAQEEDLCRCSALYPCLEACSDFYDANRQEDRALSSDAMIHSPGVPFFRDEELCLLERPFALSVVTAAAPIAQYVWLRPGSRALLRETLHRRVGRILALCAARGHRVLVLGAWGCGAFGNDPEVVAEGFASSLAAPRLSGAFDRVVFAVYAGSRGGANLAAFRARFACPAPRPE